MIASLAFIPHSTNDILVLAIFGGIAGVYLFYRGLPLLQRRRLILNTPASKVRSASMGLVKLSGLAVGPYTIPAPITVRDCYYYRTIAWQLRQSGRNRRWEKVADESRHVPFYLDDNTGRVLVDPQDAELDIHRDFHDEFSSSVFSSSLEILENISSFLTRHGVGEGKPIKIEEYCVKPKNALFILGTLAENFGVNVSPVPVQSLTGEARTISVHRPVNGGSSPATALEQAPSAPREIIRLSNNSTGSSSAHMTQQGKIAAALMKSGITNPAAWAAAGIQEKAESASVGPAASGSATAVDAGPQEFDLHPAVVLMKVGRNPFFISWRSQREVVRSLHWKST